MNLTPGQIREILPLSEDTLRHWKRTLPPLRHRNGYRPCFTHGDLLALAIIKSLVEEVGLRVSALADVAEALFLLCNQVGWLAMERSKLLIRTTPVGIDLAPTHEALRPNGTMIVVDCLPLVSALRDALTAWQPNEFQRFLRFPPAAVANAKGS